MNKKQFTEVCNYEAPSIEIISAVIERGFEASFGDFGEAGDDFEINDNGDF